MADPTELALTPAQATALGGTNDSLIGIPYITESAQYFDKDTSNNAIRNRMADMPNSLRLVKTNTGLGYGVYSGTFQYGPDQITYAGLASGTFTNNTTNYVYLDAAGALVENTTGFPTTPHIPIAQVATGTASAATVPSKYDFADIIDKRSAAMWQTVGGPGVKILTSQSMLWGDFEDNTPPNDDTGYLDFSTGTIPAGAIVIGWEAVVSTGFTGDTSAIAQVGVSGDLDAWSADTAQSVFAAATVGSASLAAEAYNGAAATPRVTITSDSDFTSVSAGAMVVTIHYMELN